MNIPNIKWFPVILSNFVPVVGVLVFRWEVFPIVLFYWLENVLTGVFNIPRLALAGGPAGQTDAPKRFLKLFLPLFFCFHYGMFTFVHGVFVFALFNPDHVPIPVPEMAVALLFLIGAQIWDFFFEFLKNGEYRHVSPSEQMARPYKRIVALHLAILGGAFFVMSLGSTLPALIILVSVKALIDIGLLAVAPGGGKNRSD